MNSQSKLLLAIGFFVATGSCFGQRPPTEKPIIHFAADIIKVDSILFTSSHCNPQRTSNIPPRFTLFENCNIRFELNRGKGDWKGESICHGMPVLDRPKKTE